METGTSGPSVELREELNLLVSVIRSYVNVVLPQWNDDKKDIATAVMLRAGNRLFAITAAQHPLDIAILELEDRPDVIACDIQQLSITVPTPPSSTTDLASEPLFWLVGFSAELALISGIGDLTVTQIAFGASRTSATQDELALSYEKEGFAISADSHSCEISFLPKSPHGFSGAGVWGFHRAPERALFNPRRHIRLYGIQYSWLDRSRLVKAVPSRIIVELLFEHYPELSDLLIGYFHALASSV